MKHATNCKFCHMPITVEIHDDYVGNSAWVLSLACCNECAKLRENRRSLEKAILELCFSFHRSPKSNKLRDTVAATLETLTKKYTRLIGDWHKVTPEWQQSIVNRLVAEPDRAWLILNSLWPKLEFAHDNIPGEEAKEF